MEINKNIIKLNFGMLLLLALGQFSCTKNDTGASNVNLPVVEAYLIPGQTIMVKVYQQKGLTDTTKYGKAIKGLQLTVSDGVTALILLESSPGKYTAADKGFLVAGKIYTLNFTYLTYRVSAATEMPGKPTNFITQYVGVTIATAATTNMSTTVLDKLSWDNPDSLNHILVFNNVDGTAFPLNNFGGSRSANYEVNTSQASYYNLKQNDFPYYGHYSIILERVNQEYINLLKSNTSSSTSQNLNTAPTNIVNGYGIFTSMQTDTISFNVF